MRECTVRDRLRSATTAVINNTNDLPGELMELHAGPPPTFIHQPFTITQPPFPSAIGVSHFIPNLSHHLHRHSDFSAWRSSLHIGASTLIKISAASHVILRRHMPCQTELQACSPNFNHPTREDPIVKRTSPLYANARKYKDLKKRKDILTPQPVPMRWRRL